MIADTGTKFTRLNLASRRTLSERCVTHELNEAGCTIVENKLNVTPDVDSRLSGALYKAGREVFTFHRWPTSWIVAGNVPMIRGYETVFPPPYAHHPTKIDLELRQFTILEDMKQFVTALKRFGLVDN